MLALLLLIVSLGSVQAQESVDTDALFETIFGGPPASQSLDVPWRLDDQLQDPILVFFTPGQEQTVEISAAALVSALMPVLIEPLQTQLLEAIGTETTIAIAMLRAIGIDARFNSQALILEITLDPSQRQVVEVDDIPAGTILAAPWSGYFNLRAGQNWGLAPQPLELDTEGILNYRGWVLESNVRLRSAFWERGDTRLVHDFTEEALRLVVGDLAVPIVGYQTAEPQIGVTVARNFSLQPYRITRPVANYEFFLQEPARVDVVVDGAVVQTLELEAGPQDVRDLPLATGLSDIELIITDAVGRVERLRFPANQLADLLAPGIQQFAYSVGAPDQGSLTLTSSYRWGVTPVLTLGGYLQADRDTQLVGMLGSWAAPVGSLSWDLAVSRSEEILDVATRGRYSLIEGDRSLSLNAEYRGASFLALSDSEAPPLTLGVSYSQNLGPKWRGGVAADYRFGDANPDTYLVAMNLDRSLANRARLNMRFSQQQQSTGESEFQARFSVSFFQPSQRRSMNASMRLGDVSEFRFAVNRSPSLTIGGLNRALTISRLGDRRTLDGALRYTGFRVDASLRHLYRTGGTHEQQLTFGTALAFVGNTWAWSRPIRESFVLVQRHPRWQEIPIEVNPGFRGPLARADARGPAVLPGLTPYRFSQVRLDAPSAPLGLDLGDDRLTVLPTYRSGSLITAGTAASITARGVLVAVSGEPSALSAGEVRSLDNPEAAPIPFFTNRTGRFSIEGLAPGRYQLQLFDVSHTPLILEFGAEQEGLLDLGSLQLKP